jgi:hypothetical protein
MLLEQARLRSRLPKRPSSWPANWRRSCVTKDRLRPGGYGTEFAAGIFTFFTEGVALMCLAEALLRIPDKATRDALIRDKISNGNWQSHIGRSPRCSSTPPPGACCLPANWSLPITKPACRAR